MERVGFFILKDAANRSKNINVDSSAIIAIMKQKDSYYVYSVNIVDEERPRMGSVAKSKLAKTIYEDEFVGKNAKFVNLEDVLRDDNTIIVGKEYSREINSPIVETKHMVGGTTCKIKTTVDNYYENCVLAAILPDGRVILDDLSKNSNVACRKYNIYSRIPAFYILKEGFNPNYNKFVKLGKTIGDYSVESIINTFNSRYIPTSPKERASAAPEM